MSGPSGDAAGAGSLQARVCREAGWVTVVLSGDLDRLTGPTLIALVRRVLQEHPGPRIDLDLAGVDFLDLGGLRALLRVHRYGARDGTMVTARNPQHYVRWLLEVTGAAEIVLTDHRASPVRTDPPVSWVNRHLSPEAEDAARVRLIQERTIQAADRERLADEREKLLDERQQRLADHQQWADLREDLADQRELDLERRERDA